MRARNFNVVPDHASAYVVIPSHANLHTSQLRCLLSTEVAPLLSSTGSKSSSAFNNLHDGKTQLSSPSRKERYVESQQTGMPQQGDSLPHRTIWKAGLQEQFGEQLSMIQWQQKVTALTQKAGESLQQYTFAKLKIMSRCPVLITDKERIEYLVQGIRDDQVATSIAVQRPCTVDDFLSIISEVDRALDHASLISSPQPAEQFARQLGRPSSRVLLPELTVL
ncbi:hypothetical protein HPB49_002432 [Dermacentor silvarum]|uniref:Uncharacterized protein n=1 Tax=Dermacentor silvarum TaxID=543639 RepID=A0ACB8CUU1_DERSI|nr:hypothetical protein HPB49_002432 [Dermacentor silvarum]